MKMSSVAPRSKDRAPLFLAPIITPNPDLVISTPRPVSFAVYLLAGVCKTISEGSLCHAAPPA